MKNYIKCTNCGSTDFVRTDLESFDIFEVGVVRIKEINAYACKRCGHIELFQASLDTYAKELREKAEDERKKEEENKKMEIQELKDEISKTQAIIDNLESTQRQVIEAKEKLSKLKKEYSEFTGAL